MNLIGAILLAAGESTRLGQPKQLIQFEGTSLVRRATLAALSSECSSVIVVLGANQELVKPELNLLSIRIVENQNWKEGMASSLRAGLEALSAETNGEAEAAIIMLCDQPMVTSEVLNRIVQRFLSTRTALVASEYENTLGVPALFRRDLFPTLLALKGAEGAKKAIAKYRNQAEIVPFPQGSFDIDTPEDLLRLARE